ncbi:maleylacetate reductase [Azospirillum sp. TSO35-2]|uniref:maleylacetate reductase n=1 Tax=Azospirillum sp. TSO35-2 TaxID=716796 RepID=UPI000D611104|nr:maleylacetate reductase [Azospirillum sp. TSO35-2]PWC32891.1 Maleylacetate reductase [Azospirillum sp. TSO35-2]
MIPFVYTGSPMHVVFGSGTITRLGSELERLGCRRALLLTGRRDRAAAEAAAVGRIAGVFEDAAMHTPVDVTERALAVLQDLRADCTVAIGGGSAIGLGKAIALRTDLPQVVVPTTYAGSEMTPILGQTEKGHKTTQRSAKVLPETVIYDVDLTLSLPPALSVTSGMNAMAHAVEALYAQASNPVTSLMAEEAIRALGRALPRIVAAPTDRGARSDALYGAWLCGICLGTVGMALHHKLCHALGGTFGLPHAQTHSVVLPHVIAYNAPAAPDAMARVATALGTRDAARGLFDLAARLGAPSALKDLGMPEDGIDEIAALSVRDPYWNPRPFDRGAIRNLLRRAWAGLPPDRLEEPSPAR